MDAASGRVCHEWRQKYAHTFAVEIGQELGFFRLLFNRHRELDRVARERERKGGKELTLATESMFSGSIRSLSKFTICKAPLSSENEADQEINKRTSMIKNKQTETNQDRGR